MIEPPHDFGYAEFIKRYNCTVGPPKHINGMTVSHVVPRAVPSSESALDRTIVGRKIFEDGFYVVFSGGQIVGTKTDLDIYTLATIVDNGIKSYVLDKPVIGQKPVIDQKLGVGRSTMIWGGFEDFLLNAFRSFNPTSGNDVWVRYIREGNLFVPFYVAFDNFDIQAREVSLPFEHEERGCKYSLSKDMYSLLIGHENLLIASKEDKTNMIEARFPESISEGDVSELERVLMTDTEWINLLRTMPILQHSRIPKS